MKKKMMTTAPSLAIPGLSAYIICRVCLQPADIRVVKEQQNGVVMEGRHTNGSVHSWLKYKSMLLNTRRRGHKPDKIVCPRCGKEGKVNQFRPDSKDPLKTAYVVKHEPIKGTWGKQKMQKMRRCFIRDKEMMDAIDQKLGRFTAKEVGA